MNSLHKTVGASGTVLAHCGGRFLESSQELWDLKAPEPTKNHYPTPFGRLYNDTCSALRDQGYHIGESVHVLSHNDMRYFGLIQAQIVPTDRQGPIHPADGETPVYEHLVGLRASWDKKFSNQLVLGTRVFVCDNLAFNGEILISRKNTLNAVYQLPEMTNNAVRKITNIQAIQDKRHESYINAELAPKDASHAILGAIQRGVIGGGKILKVIDQFERPTHEEHLHPNGARTVWTLQNAFTDVFKEYSLDTIPTRSAKLLSVLDKAADFKPVLELSA